MRIYADFNGLQRSAWSERLVVPLDTFGALVDLAQAGIVLSEGTRLTIWCDSDEREDLEADAIARFDPELGCWVAEIDDKGYRLVPTQNPELAPLPCVQCRTNLDPIVRTHGLNEGTACPACGALARLPVLPPQRRQSDADC